MKDLFLTLSTNEMCVILTEIGVSIPIKHRNIMEKLVRDAIQDGKLEVVGGKIRAITPLRRRNSQGLSLQDLMRGNGDLVARKVNMDSPRVVQDLIHENTDIVTKKKDSPRIIQELICGNGDLIARKIDSPRVIG